MTTPWRSLQGKAREDRGRELALKFFKRDPSKLILIGPVSLEIRECFGLNETEFLLDGMVEGGLLRLATSAELSAAGLQHGYFLTAKGHELLP